jgi:hypothetical protein
MHSLIVKFGYFIYKYFVFKGINNVKSTLNVKSKFCQYRSTTPQRRIGVQGQHEAFLHFGSHGNNTLANCYVLKGRCRASSTLKPMSSDWAFHCTSKKKSSFLRSRLPIKYPAAPTEIRINGRISKFKKSEDVNRIRDSLKNYYQSGLPALIFLET